MADEAEKNKLSSSRIHQSSEFDGLLKKIGGFSKFQYIQWLLLFLAIIPQSWYTYAPAFAARKVDETKMSCTNLVNVTGKAICKDEIWKKTDYCGKVKYSPDFTSIATDWNIICEDAKKYIPLTKTIFYAGKLVGAYLFGWISDRYGRRVTLLSTMFIQFVASLIQSFSVNFTMYVILRVPLGICSGGTLIAAFALMAEMVAPNRRNIANILAQGSYGVGIPVLALIGYLVRDWMAFNLAITIPNLLFVLYCCFVPESPRWLAARGRTKEAEVILRKIAQTNGCEYEEGDLEHFLESHKKDEARKTYHFWHLFSTRYLTKITIFEAWSWLVVSGVYYGLSFNSGNLSGDYYVNYAASGLVEIPAYLVAGYLVDKINRRIPLIAYFILGAVALLSMVPIQAMGKHKELSVVVMVLALIGKFTISAAYYQVYIHAAELYPTVIRTAGLGFASLCGRIGGMSAPYVVDSTPLIYPGIIFGIASLTAGLLTFFLPETKGKPLPDYVHEDESKDGILKVEEKEDKGQTTAL